MFFNWNKSYNTHFWSNTHIVRHRGANIMQLLTDEIRLHVYIATAACHALSSWWCGLSVWWRQRGALHGHVKRLKVWSLKSIPRFAHRIFEVGDAIILSPISVNIPLQLPPDIFNGIEARRLCVLVHNVYRKSVQPRLWEFGRVHGAVVLLKYKTVAKFAVDSREQSAL